MPATIIGSNEWNTRGLVLTRQDAQEQVNGLVTVQVEYVGPSTRHDIISRSFFQDAPPPIWPSVVNPSELVTNRLYMENRTVTRANGLTTVRANYVGGLQRRGFNGYYLRESKEPRKKGLAYNYTNQDTLFSVSNDGTAGTSGISVLATRVYTPSGTIRRANAPLTFLFDERIKHVECVRIKGTLAARLPTFVRSDCAALLQTRSYWFLANKLSAEKTETTDLWIVEGDDDLLAGGLRSFEKDTPVPSVEKSNFVTPSVEVVTFEHRLTR